MNKNLSGLSLADIAEAAFITDSPKSTIMDIDMDENQVDSDICQVASEIAKTSSNSLDENSDADFEDSGDDAVEKNESNSVCDKNIEDISRNRTNKTISMKKPQTVIKIDVIEEINDTSVIQMDTSQDQTSQESLNIHKDANDDNCWKIDYIRVETEEKNRIKSVGKNEIWKTKKHKRDNEKKHKSSKRMDREFETNKRKNINRFSVGHSLASRADKLVDMKNEIKHNDKKNVKKQKVVENWEDVIRLRICANNNVEQISSNVMEPYNPSVPRRTSKECIDALSDSDLEMLPCPACHDKFLLPTTFFQHLFRKSVQINFECKICQKTIAFHNKCLVRIHILGHLESDNLDNFETDMLEVVSLSSNEIMLNSDMYNYSKGLKSLLINGEKEELCLECYMPISKENLHEHFTHIKDESCEHTCEYCKKAMPTQCSLLAHERIHKKMPPYVCPECGKQFYTWQYFQNHVEKNCYHHRRTMMSVCPLCPKENKFTSNHPQVLQHIVDSHCKQYLKCMLCPSAFLDQRKFSSHWSEKHSKEENEETKILLKLDFKKETKFYENKESFIKEFTKMQNFPFIFVFSCTCQEYFWISEDLSEHLKKNEMCKPQSEVSDLFDPSTDDVTEYREVMDNLRYFKNISNCSSCNKYNENYQKHLERHGMQSKNTLNSSLQLEDTDSTSNSDIKMTRLMKRITTAEAEKHTKRSMEIGDNEKTPPLKLKIKLTPEISKSIQPIKISKKEEKKNRSKNSKVKFIIPEPVVEPLGIDVPNGRNLLLLNHLFHSPNAFCSGSVVKAKRKENDFQCSHCDFIEADKLKFQKHISQHKSCQSYFQCLECGACFAAEPSWKKHLLLMHRIKDPDPENYCQDLLSPNYCKYESYPYESSHSEDGDLVIDTGEEYDHDIAINDIVSPSETPCNLHSNNVPNCLACGENFPNSTHFKNHKCSTNWEYPMNHR